MRFFAGSIAIARPRSKGSRSRREMVIQVRTIEMRCRSTRELRPGPTIKHYAEADDAATIASP